MKYSPELIEKKWQVFWEDNATFKAEDFSEKPKYYVLDMFPYPSGAGLHVGHPEGYTASDIICRYKRMKGFNVLHPIGWDAFGLPAEQFALKTGTHPAITTEKNINNFRRQIKSIGFSYDWSREISTCSSDYYRWTQWIFRKLYEKGLAYMDDVEVNWCPALGTVLANEEVIDGKSERGQHDVVKKPMRQWMLRITEYADSLLDGLEDLDWPEGVKEMQRNWIGKSTGASVTFQVSDKNELNFEVYTTRPDTLFGATYCVLAPEHPLIEKITSKEKQDEVFSYAKEASNKLERTRLEEADNKTGVFTGAYALNPLNQKKLPIYVADYVLMSYGSGAIMAVPAHDQRDWDFAKKFNIEILEVVEGGEIEKEAYSGDGKLINSDFLNGLTSIKAKEKVLKYLEDNNLGKGATKYKLRDWLFSRQRYWGEPFPIVHAESADGKSSVKLLPEEELPVLLPEIEAYQPTEDGKPPLARAKDWLEYKDKNGNIFKRETNTMPQWAGSCWYYLRYIDPKNDKLPWCSKKEASWMPVDLYIGGAEHAVLHLLYSRFWHHVLFDLGLVSTKEPFKKLVNQGMILGEDGSKMSKSSGNVINPDEIIEKYGADTLRIYEMFMGPLEQVKPWNNNAVGGMFKFLGKVWKLFISEETGNLHSKITDKPSSEKINKKTHQTIKKVTHEIESLKFHTALASLMTLLNELSAEKEFSKEAAKTFVLLLSPFAPHIAEELWQKLGHNDTLAYAAWPEFKEELTKESELNIPIQINGKKRDVLVVEAGLDKDAVTEKAKELEKVKKHLEGQEIIKEIYVPDRLINFVIKKK